MADHKVKGNEAMARNDYGAAVLHYTRGIDALEAPAAAADEIKAQLHVLYSNRAQAQINLRKFAEAVTDSSKAIALNPSFVKSYLRRGTANLRLEALDAAAADLTTLKTKPQADLTAAGIDAQVLEDLNAEVAAKRKLAAAREETLSEKELGQRWLAAWASDAAHPRRFILPSGVACDVVVAGSGALSPTANTNCSVHYAGTLRDGTTFDSSIERNDPATFAPNQVIGGWTEVLQYMVEGDEWDVLIPSDKAYGKRGAGSDIPPNATLRFTIRLVKVLDGPKNAKPAADGRKLLQAALGASRTVESVLPTA